MVQRMSWPSDRRAEGQDIRPAQDGGHELRIAPGCYDAISASVLVQAGFKSAYLTPFGVRATSRGYRGDLDPWLRLLDLADQIQGLGVDYLIVDAHTGLEGARSVAERLHDLEPLAPAAVVIEDRLTFGPSEPILITDAMERTIARSRAQLPQGTALIARTDTVRISLDEARSRCKAYLAAGADLVMPLMTPFLPHPDSEVAYGQRLDAYRFLSEVVPVDRMVIHSPTGRHLKVSDAMDLGFAVYLMPQLLVAAAATAMQLALRSLPASRFGDWQPLPPTELADLLGVDDWLKRRW